MKAWDALISAFKSLQSTPEHDRMKLPFKDLRKIADHERMQWIVSDIDHMNKVEKRKRLSNRASNDYSRGEIANLAMQQLTDIACSAMESMSSRDISRANNEHHFKRYPTLHAGADISTGILESYDIDSRDLSIAFGNEFAYTPNTKTYEAHTRMFDDVSKNGMYVIDVPYDQILSAMSQMEYIARKKSPKWVKSNFRIPKKAYETRESFNTFMEKFYKKHGIFCAK